jgi:predicted AAA+ superfamily ATPase
LKIDDRIIKNRDMYIHRLISERLKRLTTAFPIVVVGGARQVGKSTLVEHLFADSAQIVVFDPVLDIENARRDPELFLNNRRPPLVLDEIQYAPEVVAAIKRRVDRSRTPGQYILTGSQQWGVLKSLAESLAGRSVFLDLDGFNLAEIAGASAAEPWLARWLRDPEEFAAAPPSRLMLKRPLYEQL